MKDQSGQKKSGPRFRYWLPLGALALLSGILIWQLAELSGRLTLDQAYSESVEKVEYLCDLRDALAEREIELTVLAFPYRHHLFGDPDSPENGISEGHFEEVQSVSLTLGLLEKAGIQAVDLSEAYKREYQNGELWREDGVHLTGDGGRRIAKQVNRMLQERNLLRNSETMSDSHQVFMGDCFALRLESLVNEETSGSANLKGLPCNNDRGRVANLLFLFPDEYLEGCARVYWIMSYRTLFVPGFAPLETDPKFSDGEVIDLKVTVEEGIGLGRDELGARFKTMPYRDALWEIPCRVVGEESDRSVILVTYAAKDRIAKGITGVKPGDVLNAKLIPLNDHLKSQPKVASESYFKTCDSFELPRYWILDWVFDRVAKSSYEADGNSESRER